MNPAVIEGSTPLTMRVLLVEDDDATHEVMKKILVRGGYDVVSAMTMADGLELLGSSPDCVILDLMLPDGDGETILRKIRRDGLPIRVVVASAVFDVERLRGVRELRPDAMLTKPISVSDLLQWLGSKAPC